MKENISDELFYNYYSEEIEVEDIIKINSNIGKYFSNSFKILNNEYILKRIIAMENGNHFIAFFYNFYFSNNILSKNKLYINNNLNNGNIVELKEINFDWNLWDKKLLPNILIYERVNN